ncbi:MAG: citrate/2-methylcitrate synthase [Planctomycetaceae bacterium]
MRQTTDPSRHVVDGLKRLMERVLMNGEAYHPGLEGVIAGETAVSTIEGGLAYRGYSIEDLAAESSFLETAYLLLHGELPSQELLADFQSLVAESAEVEPAVIDFLREIPLHAGAMDVLRTGISAVAHFDPQLDENDRAANVNKAIRLLARIPVLIGARHRLRDGQEPLAWNHDLSFAGNVLSLITGREPTPLEEKAMDVSLILYAEHEFNASTFTARVVTSTMSDLYSAVTAAVGALKGPLHGGANEKVMAILEEVGSPANAEDWARQALREKRRVMGFGHRVYKTEDPRATLLADYCRQLAEQRGGTDLEQIAETIETIIRDEKSLPPNLDWPSARLYHYLGLDVELYTPLFVASRVVGWSAHVIEQAENNRLIRPRSHYIGPPRRDYVPLARRG